MTDAIHIFSPNSKEYKRLLAASVLLSAETGKQCKVNDTYFDYGQNWEWTTISIESGMKTFPFVQALNPKQQNNIVFGDLDTFHKTIKELVNHYNSEG